MSAPRHDLGYRTVPVHAIPPDTSWWIHPTAQTDRATFSALAADRLKAMQGSWGDKALTKPMLLSPWPVKGQAINLTGGKR